MLARVQLNLPLDASYVPVTRGVVTCLLDEVGVPEEAAGDIKVALSEACANVVRHSTGTEEYSVTLEVGPEGCEVEIIDRGSGWAATEQQDTSPPGAGSVAGEAEGGRGMLLMRELVDDFQFVREHDATRVRLVKRWANVSADGAG